MHVRNPFPLPRSLPLERHRSTATALCVALFLLLPGGRLAAQEAPRHWLFVGNSLVQVHEVQNLVAGFAPRDRPIEAERVTLGGATLKSHLERSDPGAPLTRLEARRWEVVVLQPNGKLAMTERPAGLEPYALRPARTLVEAARRRGARPILMMTWTYRGREHNRPGLRRNYARLAEELRVPVAPVGDAFALAEERHPEIELLQSDGIHAAPGGAYLAAAVLYATIEKEPPRAGRHLPPELSRDQADELEGLAWEVVERAGLTAGPAS